MASSDNASDTLAELQAISKLIQDSIDNIQSTMKSKRLDFPSPHTPMTLESEGPRMLPEVEQSCSIIVSAAMQLIHSVRSPMQSVIVAGMQHSIPAALSIAMSAHVAEICRDAGPQGVHVKEISNVNGIDPSKLARILRALSSNHIFVEVAPDVFANNRNSSALDSGKSVKELKENPESKFQGRMVLTAGLGHCTDEAFKSASYLHEAIFDPEMALANEPTQTALNLAFDTKQPVWEWLELKKNDYRRMRFGYAMESVTQATSPSAILEGFPWGELSNGSVVVDIGGGVGTQTLTLSQTFPDLQFVVQDRESIIKAAIPFWNSRSPDAITSGRVVLQVHDFFEPQPVKNAAVFFLRMIIHDWPDHYCIRILRQLRDAATPQTRLLIVDNIMSYACVHEGLNQIPGAQGPLPPSPLLPNGGHVTALRHSQDIQMMSLLAGKERTVLEIQELMEKGGWKLTHVHQGDPGALSTQKAVAVPL